MAKRKPTHRKYYAYCPACKQDRAEYATLPELMQAGLVVCPECGEPMEVTRRPHRKNKHRGGLAPDKYLTESQMATLRAHAAKQAATLKSRRAQTDYVIVETLCLSGLRAAELCALQIRDLPCRHGKHVLMVRNGKGSVSRPVDVSPQLAETIKAYVDRYRAGAADDEPLFLGCHGKPLAYRVLYSKIVRLGTGAGLAIAPHRLRHSYATDAWRKSKDLRWLQDQLGHADPRTTAIYTKTGDELRRQYAAMMR